MSSNLGRIPPLTSELVALERMKKMSYNLVSTLVPSFLIGSSSFLQVTRTSIIFRTSSNVSKIRPRTAELAALERLKKILIDLYWGKSCLHSSSFIFDWIFFILAGNKDNFKSLDEFEFGQNSDADFGVSCPCASEKTSYNLVSTLALSF